ncbi:hypothetical protein CAEBREN_25504 [Caenorhabditis brenneri]|uniref:Uncharacterized protein n=1 Tax=Caenorhabditis brenneri TaxID=135651 RepID=G0NDQ8_CAEBE|nr:hypothetical protein CAEBREN_25504 [Caenorhabditis brenneri]
MVSVYFQMKTDKDLFASLFSIALLVLVAIFYMKSSL